MKPGTILAIGLGLLALAPSSWAQQRTDPTVVLATAEMKVFPLSVEALGNARANEAIEIRPEISATLTAIRFEEGQEVEAGTVLAELENVEPLADLAAARASLVDSEAQYQRLSQLFRTQAVAESQLQQVEAQRQADRAAVAAAEARVADTVIKAPFSGRLGLRRVSVGSLVSPQTVITTLDDVRSIKLDFDVPEVFLSRIEPGLPISARSAAWPDIEFIGTVSSVDSRVDPISRTVTVRSIIPNEDGRLRAGMFLTVTLLKDSVVALLIPEQALVPERSVQYVYVVGDDLIAHRREVRTGRRRPGEVEIVAGLQPGERVIVSGTQKARDGQAVSLMQAEARATP
ncbi:MAG: efflux RND transporter periplasmic adaptor subunit [Xanthomonadales bacterium]|nr:efflux RND transporter periplasmic adaptor subunit [Xanthomonadales bacterium]